MAPLLAEETVLAYLAKTPRVKRGVGGAKDFRRVAISGNFCMPHILSP